MKKPVERPRRVAATLVQTISDVELDTLTELDPKRLVEQLRKTFRAPGYQPPRLPAEALELLRLSRKPDVTFDEILALVERDSLLAAQVLRTAQSALYGMHASVQSLRQALVRLGLTTLSDIFLATAMNLRVFRTSGYERQMADLRKHSVATAHIARVVSRHTAFFDEYAFLCGLLHDVGIAALIIALTDGKKKSDVPPIGLVWPPILVAHADASAALCKLWGLPSDVVLAVAGHHVTGQSGNHVHPLAAVVAIADRLATKFGAGLEGDRGDESCCAEQQALGLSDGEMGRIAVEARAVVAKVE